LEGILDLAAWGLFIWSNTCVHSTCARAHTHTHTEEIRALFLWNCYVTEQVCKSSDQIDCFLN